jgi:hypothetical protein
MPIELTCPGCGKQLRLADEHAGKSGRCPACQATFQIPTASEQAATPFGGSAPTQPFGAAPSGSSPPDLFGQQPQSNNPPNPFASSTGMQSPYGGANPYSSPSVPNVYTSASGDGKASTSLTLGIVSTVLAVLSPVTVCCCSIFLMLPCELISAVCGGIGIYIALQVPAQQRMPGLILSIIGSAISGLILLGIVALFVIGLVSHH